MRTLNASKAFQLNRDNNCIFERGKAAAEVY